MGSLHRLFGGPALAGDWDWWGLLLSLLPSPPSSCKAGLGVGGRPRPDERVGPPPAQLVWLYSQASQSFLSSLPLALSRQPFFSRPPLLLGRGGGRLPKLIAPFGEGKGGRGGGLERQTHKPKLSPHPSFYTCLRRLPSGDK